MLDTPRMVMHSGSSSLIPFTALSVSTPALRYSSWPVEMGRVSVVLGEDPVNAFGDRDLLLRSQGHPLLVDRERYDRGAELADERNDLLNPLHPVFHVYGID